MKTPSKPAADTAKTLTPQQKATAKNAELAAKPASYWRKEIIAIEVEIADARRIEAQAEAAIPPAAFAARTGDAAAVAELASLNSQVIAARNSVGMGVGALKETKLHLEEAEHAEQVAADRARAERTKVAAGRVMEKAYVVDDLAARLNAAILEHSSELRSFSSHAPGLANRVGNRLMGNLTGALHVSGLVDHTGLPRAEHSRRQTLAQAEGAMLAQVLNGTTGTDLEAAA